MAKRRTIGDNPLDAVSPGAGEPTAAGRARARTSKERATAAQERPGRSPGDTGAPGEQRPEELLPRLERLEQENQCLKWLTGAILVPLALIALLA